MKKITTFTLLFFAFTLTTFAQPYTDAKTLLKASYAKLGGDLWKNVTTMKTTGNMTVGTQMGDLDGTITSTSQFPGYGRQDITIGTPMGEVVILQVVTPTAGWMKQAFNGEENEVDMEAEQLESSKVKSANEELDILSDSTATFALTEETFESKSVYAVKITENEKVRTRFYDKESLLCVGTKSEGESSIISDYKEVQGLMIPHKVKRTASNEQGDQEMTMTIKTVEINPTVAETLFKKG